VRVARVAVAAARSSNETDEKTLHSREPRSKIGAWQKKLNRRFQWNELCRVAKRAWIVVLSTRQLRWVWNMEGGARVEGLPKTGRSQHDTDCKKPCLESTPFEPNRMYSTPTGR
jgi:hypothetical protein